MWQFANLKQNHIGIYTHTHTHTSLQENMNIQALEINLIHFAENHSRDTYARSHFGALKGNFFPHHKPNERHPEANLDQQRQPWPGIRFACSTRIPTGFHVLPGVPETSV